MGKFIDLTGQRFGKLVVIKKVGKDKHGYSRYMCLCDCGKETFVSSGQLLSKNTKSCGCLKGEVTTARNKLTTKHGMRDAKIYRVWIEARRRCYNPNRTAYKNYGARGIKICDEWMGENGFQNFYEWSVANGYNPNAKRGECTLDRIDVNGNYEPSNCRWISMKEQQNNRRNNHVVTYNGETLTVTQIAEKYKINRACLSYRLKSGKSLDEAINTPVRGR